MSALHTLVEAAERATEGDGPKPAHAPAPALTEEERKQKIKSLPRVARTPLPAAALEALAQSGVSSAILAQRAGAEASSVDAIEETLAAQRATLWRARALGLPARPDPLAIAAQLAAARVRVMQAAGQSAPPLPPSPSLPSAPTAWTTCAREGPMMLIRNDIAALERTIAENRALAAQLRDAQRIPQALAVVRQVNALDEKLAILRAQLLTWERATQATTPAEVG